ncbi:MAG: hypothetical protein WBV73_10850 [Phormidium sp.]
MKFSTAMQFAKISLPTITLLALISGCFSTETSPKVEAQIAPNATPTVSAVTKSIPTKEPASTANSNVTPEIALANHLKQKDAKMYAAFWCTVCNWQERQFGSQGNKIIQENIRIECDPRGKNPQTALCEKINIRAFPTWQINGKLYEGGIPLKELADISGYSGPRNFQTSGN